MSPRPTYWIDPRPGLSGLLEPATGTSSADSSGVGPIPETDDTQSMMVDALAYGPHTTRFWGHVGGQVGHGRRVGWTLRSSGNQIVRMPDGRPAAWGFTINPQGLTYDHSNRNQMFATKSRFYVDAFGPGSVTITLRQLVASGGYTGEAVFAAREDVLTWLAMIYEPAIQRGSKYRVFFHDMHLDRTSGASGWEVFFPNSPVSVQRSVDLHNVWLVQITMQTLTPNLYSGLQREISADSNRTRATYHYRVVKGDTLHRIAQKAVKHDHHRYSLEQMTNLILRLNPAIKQKRVVNVYRRGGQSYPSPFRNGPSTPTPVTVKSMHVTPGESLILPK
jgi:hypothetical protein